MDEAYVTIAAEIVAAYVANNSVAKADLPKLIGAVHTALRQIATVKAAPEPVKLEPAVPIKKSVTPDFIVSLEDGRKFKTLKRYLMASHGMTPADYRTKWGLPDEYPMVAPNYAAKRSALAKTLGFGLERRGKGKAKKR